MDRRRDVGGSARNFTLVGRARTHGGHAPEVGREPAHGPSGHRDEIELLWDEETPSLPKDGMFLKKKFWTDEQIAQIPALGQTQREWDALSRREQLRQRLAFAVEYELPTLWSRIASGGVYVLMLFLFIGGPIIKFLVPGGSDWLRRNVDTVFVLCLAPFVLGFALSFVAGWIALPFWLGRGLWRWLRGYESEKAAASQSREAAISKGVVEHRLGVDDFEEVHEALREGKYVIFDTAALEDDEEDVE